MERQAKKEIAMSEKKGVDAIELIAPREVVERAESYAEHIDAGDKVVAALDYIAGALEERILLLEWNSADEWPDTDRPVLTKDKYGCYRMAYCDGGRWSEEGVKYWREIYELD